MPCLRHVYLRAVHLMEGHEMIGMESDVEVVLSESVELVRRTELRGRPGRLPPRYQPAPVASNSSRRALMSWLSSAMGRSPSISVSS